MYRAVEQNQHQHSYGQGQSLEQARLSNLVPLADPLKVNLDSRSAIVAAVLLNDLVKPQSSW